MAHNVESTFYFSLHIIPSYLAIHPILPTSLIVLSHLPPFTSDIMILPISYISFSTYSLSLLCHCLLQYSSSLIIVVHSSLNLLLMHLCFISYKPLFLIFHLFLPLQDVTVFCPYLPLILIPISRHLRLIHPLYHLPSSLHSSAPFPNNPRRWRWSRQTFSATRQIMTWNQWSFFVYSRQQPCVKRRHARDGAVGGVGE